MGTLGLFSFLGHAPVVATVVMVYFMPRDSRHKYNYEANRPWNYSLLTAPFDITIYRDSATVKRTMVPIYRRDSDVGARAIDAVTSADSLPQGVRRRLVSILRDLYGRGIVDQGTATLISRGSLPEVKFNENNVNISYATGSFVSQRDA